MNAGPMEDPLRDSHGVVRRGTTVVTHGPFGFRHCLMRRALRGGRHWSKSD